MSNVFVGLTITVSILLSFSTKGQSNKEPAKDGTLLRQDAFSFEPYDSIRKKYPRLAEYRVKSVLQADSLGLYRIQYASDGLKIWGFLYTPAMVKGKKYPVLIWNHGGAGERSKIGMQNFNNFYELQYYASRGFVVLASQYRGIDGSEGTDEAGGADVNDVLNLVKLATHLPYTDTSRIFMSGISRGGMMTLLAARFDPRIKAVSIVGTPTDFETGFKEKPTLLRFAQDNWPRFNEIKTEHVKRRSAVVWAEQLEAPVLIIHGSGDPAVSPRDALELAYKMEAHNKLYQLLIYALDGHTVDQNMEDRLERSVAWFKTPRKYPIGLLMRKVIQNQGLDKALSQYRSLKTNAADRYDFSETELRDLAWEFDNIIQQPETAIALLKLNVQAYPKSLPAYRDLAKAYEKANEKQKAVAIYKKALEIDPGNKEIMAAIQNLSN